MGITGLLLSVLSAAVVLIKALSPGVRFPRGLLLLLRLWLLLWVKWVVVVVGADERNQGDLS